MDTTQEASSADMIETAQRNIEMLPVGTDYFRDHKLLVAANAIRGELQDELDRIKTLDPDKDRQKISEACTEICEAARKAIRDVAKVGMDKEYIEQKKLHDSNALKPTARSFPLDPTDPAHLRLLPIALWDDTKKQNNE